MPPKGGIRQAWKRDLEKTEKDSTADARQAEADIPERIRKGIKRSFLESKPETGGAASSSSAAAAPSGGTASLRRGISKEFRDSNATGVDIRGPGDPFNHKLEEGRAKGKKRARPTLSEKHGLH